MNEISKNFPSLGVGMLKMSIYLLTYLISKISFQRTKSLYTFAINFLTKIKTYGLHL